MSGRPVTRLAAVGFPTLAALLGLVALALLVAVARARERSIAIYAHRGFAGVAPENTVEAVRAAATFADGVEVDVRRCGSGELVCVHDADLERLAGSRARVDETDLETLRSVGVGGTTASIATLDEVLAAVPSDCRVVLELKEGGLAADVLAVIDRHGADAQVSSFDADALAAIRELDADVSLAYTFRADAARALDVATELGCDAVHPRVDLCLRSRLVDRAHRRGLDVIAWTVDSRPETALAALAGVDGVFADRPLRSVPAGDRGGVP